MKDKPDSLTVKDAIEWLLSDKTKEQFEFSLNKDELCIYHENELFLAFRKREGITMISDSTMKAMFEICGFKERK